MASAPPSGPSPPSRTTFIGGADGATHTSGAMAVSEDSTISPSVCWVDCFVHFATMSVDEHTIIRVFVIAIGHRLLFKAYNSKQMPEPRFKNNISLLTCRVSHLSITIVRHTCGTRLRLDMAAPTHPNATKTAPSHSPCCIDVMVTKSRSWRAAAIVSSNSEPDLCCAQPLAYQYTYTQPAKLEENGLRRRNPMVLRS